MLHSFLYTSDDTYGTYCERCRSLSLTCVHEYSAGAQRSRFEKVLIGLILSTAMIARP